MEESYTSSIYKVATTSRAQLLFSSEFYTKSFPFFNRDSHNITDIVYVDP